jgi:hypothetical protein
MSSIFGSGNAGPKTVPMDAVLTRALCDNRKAIDGTQVTLDSILAVLLRVETLLQENVEQSQTVSAELCEAAHEMGARGLELAEEMRRGRP